MSKKKEQPKPKEQSYTLICTAKEGKLDIRQQNKNFSRAEIIGLLEYVKADLVTKFRSQTVKEEDKLG